MSDILSVLIHPVELVIAAVLARLHELAATLGLTPGAAWLAALAGLVVVVRAALVPLAARQVRLAHASARSQPALAAIQRRYAGRTDPESVRAMLAETRATRAEHGAGLGILPALATGIVLFGLYRLLSDVAAGVAVGALDAAAVASARTADVGGVTLATVLSKLGGLAVGPAGWGGPGWIVIGLATAAALLTYASTRWLTLPNLPQPEPAPAGSFPTESAPAGSVTAGSARRESDPRESAPRATGRGATGQGATGRGATGQGATARQVTASGSSAVDGAALDPTQVTVWIQRALPALAALGLLVSAPWVPAGVLGYWLVSAVWTAAQQAVIVRRWPTPGSAAHTAYLRRSGAASAQ